MNTVTDIGVKIILISVVISFLPMSPFQGFTALMSSIPFLSYANFFVPITEMLAILESWLFIVSSYYGILYIVNYVGLVKS